MQGFIDFFSVQLVASAFRLGTPIILAALGGAICNRAGVLNLALEGKMLLGAFLGILSAYALQHNPLIPFSPMASTYLSLIVAMFAGGILGAFFSFVYLKYKVNLIILAIAINLMILELTVYFMRVLFGQVGTWSDPSIVMLPNYDFPFLNSIPWFGEILSGYNIIVYASWALCIIGYFVLFHSKFGRHLRAVGENIEAARTVGINVTRVQVFALVISGALAALGGAFLSVGHLTLFTRNMSNGRGWLGISAALFGFNHPIGVFFSGLFFGFADAIAIRLQNVTNLPPSLIQVLPFVATLVALVLVALRTKIATAITKRRYLTAKQKPAKEPVQTQ
ncbi:MAG: ABC transporter permease [Anaerolineaceae bacterium]|nr:ABC transporter permease [Anaerolineaceae bacterium]